MKQLFLNFRFKIKLIYVVFITLLMATYVCGCFDGSQLGDKSYDETLSTMSAYETVYSHIVSHGAYSKGEYYIRVLKGTSSISFVADNNLRIVMEERMNGSTLTTSLFITDNSYKYAWLVYYGEGGSIYGDITASSFYGSSTGFYCSYNSFSYQTLDYVKESLDIMIKCFKSFLLDVSNVSIKDFGFSKY